MICACLENSSSAAAKENMVFWPACGQKADEISLIAAEEKDEKSSQYSACAHIMLTSDLRLRDKNRITSIIKKGRRVKTGNFLARVLPSPSGNAHISAVVSSKQVKTAVARNRIRRRVTETLRRLFQKHRPPCYDVVVFASKSCLTLPPEKMKQELVYIISQLPHAK